ncbi:MAG: dTMP kinase [Verrucomicrobiales bacterium]|nr:dTMP kinase [Verrucomicrobiales bacterium]
MPRGFFVTLEGSEGCGKSTQAALLVERLRGEGRVVRPLREPGGTPLGEEIRQTVKHSAAGRGMTAEAELLLMNAARAQLVREVIRPALAAGEVVVCDRYLDSTVAYQGWGRELPLDRVRAVLDLAVGETVPDLTLLFQVPATVASERRRKRETAGGTSSATDRFEAESAGFFERVEAGFRAIASEDVGRVVTIDAAPGVEAVAEAVWRVVSGRLAGGTVMPRRV